MNPRPIALLVGIFLCLFLISPCSTIAAPTSTANAVRPNILYFYVDDMGWGSIGPNAQAQRRAAGLPSVRTPNLDALAADGVNFIRAYGMPICSPARSSQQTGFHQGHTFADWNDPNNAKKAIRTDDITMGDALSKAGYTTGYWGKWGYGGSKEQENPTIDNIQTLPTTHGYQHVLAELHHVRAHTFFQPTLWHAPAKKGTAGGVHLLKNTMAPYKGKKAYADSPANHNHPDYPTTSYCDDLYATHCLDFVRTNAKKYNANGTPFFGILAVQIPHAPFDEIQAIPQWDASYKKDKHFAKLAKQSQEWSAMVTRIDAHFGMILDALEDPNGDGKNDDSVADNTLVIFMSDNGGPGGKNLIELDANGGLRGLKGSIQEGGIRVPTVMRWPAMITANSKLKIGTNSNQVIGVTDLLPTFCELAGAEIPLGIDGVSIAPTLTGIGRQRHRDFMIHEAKNGQSLIRGKYKLVRSSDKKGENVSFALYDLQKDHAENTDISRSNKELVAELTELLLGERVTEESGFANTYHHWTGKNGAKTSDANNWSDYEYSNAGITYMTDAGSPQLSWTATIENTGSKSATANLDADLETLGIEVRGANSNAIQTVKLNGHTLTGRNQIRLAPYSNLLLNGGTLHSLRWVDLEENAIISGDGNIDATLYQDGHLVVHGAGGMNITGGYFASETSVLNVVMASKKVAQLKVKGNATLAGQLSLVIPSTSLKLKKGDTFTLITAQSISGTFAHKKNQLTTSSGVQFKINYSSKDVSITVVSTP